MKISPIRTQEAYAKSRDRASQLISRTNQAAIDELEVLQALIERWERERFAIPPPTPVEAIRFRMAQAGLRPRDLEPYIGSRSRVSEVLSGTRPLSVEMIRALHHHFGVPAGSLIGAKKEPPSDKLAPLSKAAVKKLATFRLMKPREDIFAFIGRGLGGSPSAAMLRKSRTDRTNAKTDPTALQAWCAAVLLKASDRRAIRSRKKLNDVDTGRALAQLSVLPDALDHVETTLAKLGVILITLDHLPGTYLDGAAMLRGDGVPVIALTLRHDRIDNFWFTLLHEFCHVRRHLKSVSSIIIDDLELKSSDESEREADQFAQDSLIPPKLWARVTSSDLSSEDVIGIASEAGVHPAIVAGRWQREYGDYRRFSRMLGRGEVRANLC